MISNLSLRAQVAQTSSDLEDLLLGFVEQIGTLQRLSLLSSVDSSSGVREFALKLSEVEAKCLDLESHVTKEERNAEKAKRIISALKQQQAKARHLKTSLADLGSISDEDKVEPSEQEVEPSVTDNPRPKPSEDVEETNDENTATNSKEDRSDVPCLLCPDQESLASVPKYMRGRITHEQVAESVTVINETMAYKNKILKMPKAKRSTKQREKFLAWRDQETPETIRSQIFFFTAEDLFVTAKEKGVEQKTIKATLQILRYFGMLKVDGEGGFMRYTVPETLAQ